MQLDLFDKGVLVTGGNRGIGRQVALDFAVEGARVAICGRDVRLLRQTSIEIEALGATALPIEVDLNSEYGCKHAIDEAAQSLGRLDILVNNASNRVAEGDVLSLPNDQLMQRLLEKTAIAIRCSRAAIPYMRSRGGRIVCIGGITARISLSHGAAQGLGNAALANFVKHLSDEVAKHDILVNIVHPGLVRTERFRQRVENEARATGESLQETERQILSNIPIGRPVEPHDVASVVLFLSSSKAGAITGQAIAVDGGMARSIVY